MFAGSKTVKQRQSRDTKGCSEILYVAVLGHDVEMHR